jgi:hypothetical protein
VKSERAIQNKGMGMHTKGIMPIDQNPSKPDISQRARVSTRRK